MLRTHVYVVQRKGDGDYRKQIGNGNGNGVGSLAWTTRVLYNISHEEHVERTANQQLRMTWTASVPRMWLVTNLLRFPLGHNGCDVMARPPSLK